MSSSAGERFDFLDWLRVIAILVLLFFHTGMIFVGWGWHITNDVVIDSLAKPMDASHRLRMPLLFVIAGAGMWFALQRRTGAQLLKERSVRLLLPLVIGMFVVVPPQVFYERLSHDEWNGGYLQFLLERTLQLKPYPAGDLSWHHLWFILYLYVYVPLLLPLMIWWQRVASKPVPGVWLVALAVLLGINEACLRPMYPESHRLIGDWYIFNHYLLLTGYGYLLASLPGGWQWVSAHRHRFGAAVVVILVGALTLFSRGIIHQNTPIDAFIAAAFTWTGVLAFIGYGYRHLSFSNSFLRWAREASYPIYILHQTVIIAIGYYVVQMSMSPWAKYWTVLVASAASCWLLYDLVVRRFNVTRLMFGMKLHRPSETPTSQTQRGETLAP